MKKINTQMLIPHCGPITFIFYTVFKQKTAFLEAWWPQMLQNYLVQLYHPFDPQSHNESQH